MRKKAPAGEESRWYGIAVTLGAVLSRASSVQRASAGSARSISSWSALAGILVAFAGASWLATATTSELARLSFLLPIGLTLQNFGPFCAYSLAFLASLVGLPPLWTATSHFLLLVFVTALASRHLQFLRQTRERNRFLTKLLPICPNCGQLLCHDGQWRPLEQAILHSSQRPNHSCTAD